MENGRYCKACGTNTSINIDQPHTRMKQSGITAAPLDSTFNPNGKKIPDLAL